MLGIVHSAAGAWLSKASRSRGRAILLGVVSHGVLDYLGHEEPFDEEGNPRPAVLLPDIGLTVAAIVWLGTRRGWLSPGFLGSLASIVPDAEHLVRLPLGRGSRKRLLLFPSHRFESLLHSKTRWELSVQGQFGLGVLLWLFLRFWQRGELTKTGSSPTTAGSLGRSL